MLESWGAEVRAAGSADEAIEALSGETPDLMISDIGMPRVDGYELMRRIRRSGTGRLRNIPSIALTAFARPEDAAKLAAQALEGSDAADAAAWVALARTLLNLDEFVTRE